MGEQGNIVHPATREVPVMGGTHRITVKPWTMARRAALRPRLAALLGKVMEFDAREAPLDLQEVFLKAEDEVTAIVQASVDLPSGLTWDEVWWEDIPNLAQALWEVVIIRPDGGGLGGKLAGVLAGAVSKALTHAASKSIPPRPSEQSSTG